MATPKFKLGDHVYIVPEGIDGVVIDDKHPEFYDGDVTEPFDYVAPGAYVAYTDDDGSPVFGYTVYNERRRTDFDTATVERAEYELEPFTGQSVSYPTCPFD